MHTEIEPESRTFRLAAKNIFVTLPQSTAVPHQVFHDHLKNVNANVVNVYTCREAHKPRVEGDVADYTTNNEREGGVDANGIAWHHHGFIQLSKKWDIRNPRACDITYEGVTYHANLQAVKSIVGSINYIEKDGDTLGDPQKFEGNSDVFGESYEFCGTKGILEQDDWGGNLEVLRHNWGFGGGSRIDELAHYTRLIDSTTVGLRWAYRKVCRGGLFSMSLPWNSNSEWLRQYTKVLRFNHTKAQEGLNRVIVTLILNEKS